MAVLTVIYTHNGDPAYKDARHPTVADMEKFLDDLILDVRWAGISVKYESVEGESNDVTINGKPVKQIIRELGKDIRRPVMDENGFPKAIAHISRGPSDWFDDCIEDISTILMKNAFSKAYADTRSQ